MRKSKKAIPKPRKRGQGPYEINRALPNPAVMSSYTPQGRAATPVAEAGKRFSWKRAIVTTLIVLVLIFGSIGGWLGWKFLSNELKVFGWDGLFSLLHKTKLKGEDRGHVNILLAGNSADDPGHNGGNLTDSIMVVSIDTVHHTAFTLSIPRDLYVNIPDFGYAKINEVYQDGQSENFSAAGYPAGGMGLLEKVVSEKLGMPIDYYALVNYTALKQSVDAIGGITVTIQSPDPRGLYDPSIDYYTNGPLVKLSNGPHTLNGQQALNLARARGDAYGAYGFPRADFNRTEHQRQILIAIKDKATSAGTLANPIKLGNLFDSFGNNVKTDMQLGEARRLYAVMQKVPTGSIKSQGLDSANGKNLLASYTTRFGQSALVPAAGIDDYSQIQAFIQQLIGPATTTTQ